MPHAITLDHLSLTLRGPSGNINVLQDLNTSIEVGQTVSVVGPSGSGKTSLLMVIAGLERATTGRINVCGHDITDLSEEKMTIFRRDHIGIVFQSFHLLPTMTALENVAVPLEFARKRNPFTVARRALEAVGLEERMYHYPSQLSGGEQQRVALARAFVVEPKLLLADEPTGNLDRETGNSVIELMFKLHEYHNTTLVLVTHDADLASRCSTKIRLQDGRILKGEPEAKPLAEAVVLSSVGS